MSYFVSGSTAPEKNCDFSSSFNFVKLSTNFDRYLLFYYFIILVLPILNSKKNYV